MWAAKLFKHMIVTFSVFILFAAGALITLPLFSDLIGDHVEHSACHFASQLQSLAAGGCISLQVHGKPYPM